MRETEETKREGEPAFQLALKLEAERYARCQPTRLVALRDGSGYRAQLARAYRDGYIQSMRDAS